MTRTLTSHPVTVRTIRADQLRAGHVVLGHGGGAYAVMNIRRLADGQIAADFGNHEGTNYYLPADAVKVAK